MRLFYTLRVWAKILLKTSDVKKGERMEQGNVRLRGEVERLRWELKMAETWNGRILGLLDAMIAAREVDGAGLRRMSRRRLLTPLSPRSEATNSRS